MSVADTLLSAVVGGAIVAGSGIRVGGRRTAAAEPRPVSVQFCGPRGNLYIGDCPPDQLAAAVGPHSPLARLLTEARAFPPAPLGTRAPGPRPPRPAEQTAPMPPVPVMPPPSVVSALEVPHPSGV